MKSVRYYYINLEQSVSRRERLERELQSAGVEAERIPAVYGADLSEPELVAYDRKRRHLEYASDLRPAEHGCIHSHMKVLRRFLETDADYAVVLEDDVTLHRDFVRAVRFMIDSVQGWEVVKLDAQRGKLLPVLPPLDGAPVTLVFPEALRFCSAGYMYSRKAAEYVVGAFSRYWMAFDTQLGYYLMKGNLLTCGVNPVLVAPTIESYNSSIQDFAAEHKKYFSPVHYVVHRYTLLKFKCDKFMMLRRLRRVLSYR